MFLNLTIGVYTPCHHRCSMESRCVSVNIGPPVNDKVVCELSDSDHIQGNSGNERANYDARKSAFFKATFLVKMAHFRLTHAYVLNVKRNLPGPCTTFSQSLSVNSLR